MSLETIELHPAGDAKASVIILHGLGADGTDFLPMCDQLDLAAIGPVRWLLPRAPVRPVTINGGHRMRAWYDVLGAQLDKREDETGLRATMRQVQTLIDREVARGVPARRIVLGRVFSGLCDDTARWPALPAPAGRTARHVGVPAAGCQHRR